MLYNAENMEGKWFEHENGYTALLYGKSSMCVYDGRKNVNVLHTGSRNVNTEAEVMELLGKMPELLQKIFELPCVFT